MTSSTSPRQPWLLCLRTPISALDSDLTPTGQLRQELPVSARPHPWLSSLPVQLLTGSCNSLPEHFCGLQGDEGRPEHQRMNTSRSHLPMMADGSWSVFNPVSSPLRDLEHLRETPADSALLANGVTYSQTWSVWASFLVTTSLSHFLRSPPKHTTYTRILTSGFVSGGI